MARIVVALGGNALVSSDGSGSYREQMEAVEETAVHITHLIEEGHEVVITHGNGPQVGNLLLQQENSHVADMPLDVLVAESQAQVGYMLQQALDNHLENDRDFLTVVTQVLVDERDPAFENPTKPVGPFYTEEEAREKNFEVKDVGDGERSYRRVVPSPEPLEIAESGEIGEMVERGNLVICCGGGGIPVVKRNGLSGVEAVVDKDRASQVLSNSLDADTLAILTDVEHACLNYGSEDEEEIGKIDTKTLKEHLRDGHFGEGSMKPKVESCIRFIDEGGERGIITSPEKLEPSLEGGAGTRVVK